MRYVTGGASVKIIEPLNFIIKFPSLALYCRVNGGKIEFESTLTPHANGSFIA
jgi:hypothetical protein